MAWGNKTAFTTGMTVSSTPTFPGVSLTLNPGESAHIQLVVPWLTTTVVNLVCGIYGTLDAATEVWDFEPLYEFIVPNAYLTTTVSEISFLISGLYKFRVGLRTDGAATFSNVAAYYRVDGISL